VLVVAALPPASALALDASKLKLEPSELTLSTDHSNPGAHATVTLVGSGAREFVATTKARGVFVLYDADNHEAKFQVKDVKPGATAGIAKATISLTNNPTVGRYKGEIALFPLAQGAPALKLTVNSHLPLWLVILLVFFGVVLGALAPRLYALNARRNVLLEALTAAMLRLNEVGAGLSSAQAKALAKITWNLNDLASEDQTTLITEPPRSDPALKLSSEGTLPTGSLPGVERLRERIREARNDRDLDEDTSSVLDVAARIERWLRLAPLAWCLNMVAEEPKAPGESWRQTNTWRDTCMLMRRLRYEPRTVAEADDLVARVLWQIDWHHAVAALLASTTRTSNLGKGLLALDGKLTKNVLERTPGERDELACELGRLRLEADRGPIIPARRPVLKGVEVAWDATPSLFTGWATLDGASWRRLRARAAQRKRTPTPREVPKAAGKASKAVGEASNEADSRASRDASARKQTLRAPGQALTFVALLILPVAAASAVYAHTLYSDLWGSWADILTALSAGFIGKVAIDWGTLYIFQSNRLRPPGKAEPSPSGTPPSAKPA